MKKNSILIPIEYKDFYLGKTSNGLKLHFCDVEIATELRNHIISLVRFWRKKFFFPIRCNIYFEFYSYYEKDKDKINDKNANAIFYLPRKNKDGKDISYPQIYIAVSEYETLLKKHSKSSVLIHYFDIFAHELAHYFQLYFLELENIDRTNRSLEREANKYANILVDYYLENYPIDKQ